MTQEIQRRQDIEICRKIHARHGKSYYAAARFFPKDLQEATYALYAFFRLPDEIVDTEKGESATMRRKLQDFESRFMEAVDGHVPEGNDEESSVLRAASAVFRKYSIPKSYAEAFMSAMVQDTETVRYETYAALEAYMYGSAAVVGLMMSYCIGYRSDAALPYAKKLGEAMQLTNFLRDIREDLEERGRIYVPEEDLRTFGVTEEDLLAHKVTPEFRSCMEFEIARARKLYQESEAGIALLDPRGRVAVWAARELYAAILKKIEDQGYDVFAQRARTSGTEKMWYLMKAIWKTLRQNAS